MQKYIITYYQNRAMAALYENDRMIEINGAGRSRQQLLGNIYIGRIEKVVSNINAAFVKIKEDQVCYLSLEDCKKPIYTKKLSEGKISAGDELLVQVTKEAAKTKGPTVSTNLNLPGRYAVLTTGNLTAGISAKIQEPLRTSLKEWIIPYLSEHYGFVIRTNAKNCTEKQLLLEMEQLAGRFKKLNASCLHRLPFSLLYEEEPFYLKLLRDAYSEKYDEIITDDFALYEEIKGFLEENQPDDTKKLRLYQDDLLSLQKLYRFEHELELACSERVWLKSGGYLILQPAEAMTVIDVNTGKFTGKKNQQETNLKINLEAAKEIARQLRLRNLSGIIIVDFINMKEEAALQLLLKEFAEYLKADPIQTDIVDVTKLQLVEITRKKNRSPLQELLYEKCSCCKGTGWIPV